MYVCFSKQEKLNQLDYIRTSQLFFTYKEKSVLGLHPRRLTNVLFETVVEKSKLLLDFLAIVHHQANWRNWKFCQWNTFNGFLYDGVRAVSTVTKERYALPYFQALFVESVNTDRKPLRLKKNVSIINYIA